MTTALQTSKGCACGWARRVDFFRSPSDSLHLPAARFDTEKVMPLFNTPSAVNYNLGRAATVPLNDPLLWPRAIGGLDYAALVDILLTLRQPIDLAGETTLHPDEADKIRNCGVEARAGRIWRCPFLPREIVGPLPALRHLCDDIDPYLRPVPMHPKRAAFRPIAPLDPLSKHERSVLKLMQSYGDRPETRLRLLKNTRFPAKYLDRMLRHLGDLGRIVFENGRIHIASSAKPESKPQQNEKCQQNEIGPPTRSDRSSRISASPA